MKKKLIPILCILSAISVGLNVYTFVTNILQQKQKEENTINTFDRLTAVGIAVELSDVDSIDIENARFVMLNGINGGDSILAQVNEDGLIRKAYFLQDEYRTMDYDVVNHALVFISDKQVLYLSDEDKRYDETEAELSDDLYACNLTYDADQLIIASTVFPEYDDRLEYQNNGMGYRVNVNLNGAQNMVPVASVITE